MLRLFALIVASIFFEKSMDVNFVGLGILALGASVAYASQFIAGMFLKNVEQCNRLSIVIKVVGFFIAVAGVLLTMNVI